MIDHQMNGPGEVTRQNPELDPQKSCVFLKKPWKHGYLEARAWWLGGGVHVGLFFSNLL